MIPSHSSGDIRSPSSRQTSTAVTGRRKEGGNADFNFHNLRPRSIFIGSAF